MIEIDTDTLALCRDLAAFHVTGRRRDSRQRAVQEHSYQTVGRRSLDAGVHIDATVLF